jgi:hypothetical protein
MERAAEALRSSVAAFRYGPGDDYELLLAVDPGRRDACERAARGGTRRPRAFHQRRGELTL